MQGPGSKKNKKKVLCLYDDSCDTNQNFNRVASISFIYFPEYHSVIRYENIENVIDKDEVRRSRKIDRTALAECQSVSHITSLYSEGQKEKQGISFTRKK